MEYAIRTHIFLTSTFLMCKANIYASESTYLKVKMAISFDKLNGEGTPKQKIELSEQLIHHFKQQPQGMSNFKGESWHCF